MILPMYESGTKLVRQNYSKAELRRLAEAIKSRCDVYAVASWFNWNYDRAKRNPCPSCHAVSTSKQTVQVDADGSRWYCHACHEHGDTIDFIAVMLNVPKVRAIEQLAGRLGIDCDPESFLQFLKSELSTAKKSSLFTMAAEAALEREVNRKFNLWACFNVHQGDPAVYARWLADWEVLELAAWNGDTRAVAAAERLSNQSTPPGLGNATREPVAFLADVYRKLLHTPHGAAQLATVNARGLAASTIAAWGFGAAPETVDTATVEWFIKNHPDRYRLLQEYGMLWHGYGRPHQSALRGRLTLPICDPAGRPIALAGRLLEGNGPKYYNTKETAIFQKARTFFGLAQALPEIMATGTAVVTEGYFHVVSSHDAGIRNVIATMGTALTPHHVMVLRRIAKHVVFAFDGDEAGRNAADEGSTLASAYGLSSDVARVPDSYDLDDIKRNFGRDGLLRVLGDVVPAREFRSVTVEQLASRLNRSAPKPII